MSQRRPNPAGNRPTRSHWEVDFYKILGVGRGVGQEELKAAYRATMRQVHPDLHPGHADSTQAAQRVNEAYDVLSNPRRRAAYHRARAALKRSRPKPRVAKRVAPRRQSPPDASAERGDAQARRISGHHLFSHLVAGAAAGILEGLLFGSRHGER